MGTKNWRPSWTTPGSSEQTHPFLDLTVNRDLVVDRDVHIKRNLKLDGSLSLNWASYSPVLSGFQGVNGTTPATGIVSTNVGRWLAIGSLVFFYVYFHVTNEGLCTSNFYFTLPPKVPVNQFSAHGSFQPFGNTDRTKVRMISGMALANATQMMAYPSDVIAWGGTGSPPVPGVSGYFNMTTMDVLITVPYEFHLSGFYEGI